MSNELATKAATPGLQIRTMDDLARVADMMAQSGYFSDAREAAQAGVKIMAGQAWGIDPFTAMAGIDIIKGKPSTSAGLMASAVKAHPKYDYRVRRRDSDGAAIEFFEAGESVGIMEYTREDATRAGLINQDNYKKHPAAMFFARAMSSGVRTYCPDVFTTTVYVPEELSDDEPIDVKASKPKASTRPALEAKNTPARGKSEAKAEIEAKPEPVEAAESGAQGDEQFPAEPPEGTFEFEEPKRTQLGTANAKRLADKLDAAGIPKKEHVDVAAQAVGRSLTSLTDLYRDELPTVLTFAASGGAEPEEDAA